MNLLILNGPAHSRPGRNPLYRGTERAHPSYCYGLPDEHEINQLFFWFLEEGGELGVVHDVQKARRFAQLWNARRTPPDQFEVIEVTDGNAPVREGTFIGFDLSSGYNNSLLAPGLAQITHPVDLSEPVLESYELISRNFAPQLNRHGLFDTFETADLCLRAMNALQQLSPNFFEWGDFQPTGLFVIGAGIP
jgi:hypothetical protein